MEDQRSPLIFGYLNPPVMSIPSVEKQHVCLIFTLFSAAVVRKPDTSPIAGLNTDLQRLCSTVCVHAEGGRFMLLLIRTILK